MNSVGPVKNVEDGKALFMAVLSAFGGGIYLFSLGYTSSLGIPDYPSYESALKFFLSSGLDKMSTPVKMGVQWYDEKIVFYPILLFIYVFSVLVYWVKRDKRRNVPHILLSVLTLIVFLPILTNFGLSIIYIVSVMLPLIVFWLLFDFIKKSKRSNDIWVAGLLCAVFVAAWSIPYLAGKSTLLLTISKKSFPSALNKQGDRQNKLLWIESDKRYWLNCKNGYLRGENASGDVFIYRYATKLVFKNVCRKQ